MSRLTLLLPAFMLCAGCETLSDAFIRQIHTDHGISRRYREQIREGLEKRENVPPGDLPSQPAPPFLDLG